ncbi:class I SAM-dependent methyltransferase [Jiella sp. MQZ9-1]|uniref:Class I SAM-dependent methyltransferase n=1 Tax=Jiella flava TaxID=2816857 RepID=A0A939JRQ9_9HYPH|nr:class I SAM-dependent methyltransferase [Jiella flava]MBO0662163.1 class I SAM-dependent methyltransferase [Jiella flava]MCD2471007.1 class I SAM-dependent methyltransferase [Jiella flava]
MPTPEALNAAFVSGDPHRVIVESLRFAGAGSVLDIGCGTGGLVASLTAAGFQAVGVDPHARALGEAQRSSPEGRFAVGRAEALAFDDQSFDAVVFLNSLHHVPVDAMATALSEARRVKRPEGALLIIEPLAEGSVFEVMRPVEDETAIRHAAGAAIADAVRTGQLRLRGNVVFDEARRYQSVDAFADRLIAVDPTRAATLERVFERLEHLFRLHGRPDGDGCRLVQPLRAYWLN